MLNAGAAALVSAFLFLVVLLLGVLPGTGGSWQARLVATATAILLAVVTLASVPGLLGWPSDEEPPAKFRLLAVHVQQPDKQTRDAGSVFLWAIDAENLVRGAEPRAYRLPYSGPLHETAAAAATKLGKGVAQLGEFSGSPRAAGGWLEEPGLDRQATIALRFYDVPDPLYPEG